ncbi:MAG: hypothetical protein SOT28_01200 [Fusicatenibacter sp.]|nr:hypothetical protein [Fusicatenibacter sp.]
MNERFFSLPVEKQEAIINAGFRVFSQNSYKKSPTSDEMERDFIRLLNFWKSIYCRKTNSSI